MLDPSFGYVSVGDSARRLGVQPWQVTKLFYDRKLREDLCPLVAGRRLIPIDYLPVVAAELRRKGLQVNGEEASR